MKNRLYSTWSMLRELQKNPTLIFEANRDCDFQPMTCHSDMRGHVCIRWMDPNIDEKPELDFIPQRHDWVITNRPKQKRKYLGEVSHDEFDNVTIANGMGTDTYSPPEGIVWEIYAVEKRVT